MKVYIEVDENNRIIRADSNNYGDLIEIEVDEDLFYSTKILNCKYQNSEVVLDEEEYNEQQKENEESKKIIEARATFENIMLQSTLMTLDDTEAYKVRYLYDKWEHNKDYKDNDRRRYGDNLYKCKQDHTSQEQYTPDLIPAIWDIIGEEQGTIDNPIVIPDTFSSMIYVKGKYYLENDVLYLMNREEMEDGEEISLTYKPSELVDIYFKVVN